MADAKQIQIEVDAALLAEVERARPLVHAAREYAAATRLPYDDAGRYALDAAIDKLFAASLALEADEAQP